MKVHDLGVIAGHDRRRHPPIELDRPVARRVSDTGAAGSDAGVRTLAQVVHHVTRPDDQHALLAERAQPFGKLVMERRRAAVIDAELQHRAVGVGEHVLQHEPGAVIEAPLGIGLDGNLAVQRGGDVARDCGTSRRWIPEFVQLPGEPVHVVIHLRRFAGSYERAAFGDPVRRNHQDRGRSRQRLANALPLLGPQVWRIRAARSAVADEERRHPIGGGQRLQRVERVLERSRLPESGRGGAAKTKGAQRRENGSSCVGLTGHGVRVSIRPLLHAQCGRGIDARRPQRRQHGGDGGGGYDDRRGHRERAGPERRGDFDAGRKRAPERKRGPESHGQAGRPGAQRVADQCRNDLARRGAERPPDPELAHVSARLAGAAAIEQRQSAVHAEVGHDIAGRHERALAGWANVGTHLLQRVLRRQRLAALGLSLALNRLPLRQICLHGLDRVVAGDGGQHDADAIAHVSSITW